MKISDQLIKEACVETFEEAMMAEEKGADRIELCANLETDGLTPAPDLLERLCNSLRIPVKVMIRPRPGNFVYSEQEVNQMLAEIDNAKKSGAAGIVIGALTSTNTIDVPVTTLLADYALPLPVTFHKAIDRLNDPVEGVTELLKIGNISHILTSGGRETAIEGAATIRKMIVTAGNNITIVAAGRITNTNLTEVWKITGAQEFHGRRIIG